MKTPLLHLIFDIATARLAHVTQHLGEHPLQRIVAHQATRRPIGILNGLVTVVADIEGSAIEMAGVLCGIAVTTTELGHIVLRTQYTGDDDLMEGYALHIEAVEEGLTYILQQHGSMGHEIGNARIEGIDVVIGIGTHIDQLTFPRLCILTILDGCHSPAVGSSQLKAVSIGKSLGVTGNGADAVVIFVECGVRSVE